MRLGMPHGQAETLCYQVLRPGRPPKGRRSDCNLGSWTGVFERFQFSLKQGYRQCPESAEGVAGYWRSNINWKRFNWRSDVAQAGLNLVLEAHRADPAGPPRGDDRFPTEFGVLLRAAHGYSGVSFAPPVEAGASR